MKKPNVAKMKPPSKPWTRGRERAMPSESRFVSAWVKANRGPIRKCECGGSVYYCRDVFKGDADWAIYQCDLCGAGFEKAGHWSYPIPKQAAIEGESNAK
jgi:hypothetical protein